MKEEFIGEIIEALTEDYTLLELTDPVRMLIETDRLMGLTPNESLPLLVAAIQLKMLRPQKPLWKLLLNIH